MLEDYKKHCKEREEMGIPPLPLDAEQTAAVINLLKNDHDENELLLFLLKERVPAGVDDAAYVKAGFLSDLTKGETESPYISKEDAVEILGTMLGGYNIQPLIDCLEINELADDAAAALSNTLLIFDSFNNIVVSNLSYIKTLSELFFK